MLRAQIESAVRSQTGHRHRIEGRGNEDAFAVCGRGRDFDAAVVVADGMGGRREPARAAAVAVAAARETLERGDGPLPERVRAAVVAANAQVRALAGDGCDPAAPGATLTVAAIAGEALLLAHVGDGAAFLARGERVERLTRPAPLSQTPREYLGRADDVAIEIGRRALRAGDRLLVCTDGLLRALGGEPAPRAIAEILARHDAPPDARVAQLLAAASEPDYDDDTTLALLEVIAIAPETAIRPAGVAARSAAIAWVGAFGVFLAALGFLVGRLTAPTTPAAILSAAPPATPAPSTPPESDPWSEAPALLVDDLGRRLLVLRTAAPPPARPGERLRLQGLRLGSDGRLTRTGRFELDLERRVLTDAQGRARPIEIDWESGVVTVLRGATLVVQSRPVGAEVYIDGRRVGVTPARLRLPMGRHTLRVQGPGWAHESTVVLPAGRVVTVSVGPE